MSPAFLKEISAAFDHRIAKHGDTAEGVLWKNADGQVLRFELLAGVLDDAPRAGIVSVNDLGCGYGALLDFLKTLTGMPDFDYAGYDISKLMIEAATARTEHPKAAFRIADQTGRKADYSFVSGTYNLRLGIEDNLWRDFILGSLADLWAKTGTAMAFNMLDAGTEHKLDGLYYADAADMMDFVRTLSDNVTLIDDYPLDEWTIYVRR